MIKNEKNEKKREENCNFPKNEKLQFSLSFFHFFHFFIIFLSFLLPVVELWNWCKMIKKMMKNDETNDKKMKKKTRKIVIFHFLDFFCTTGSKNDEKWLKNDKNND